MGVVVAEGIETLTTGVALSSVVGVVVCMFVHGIPFSQKWRLCPVSLMRLEMSPPPPYPTHLYLGTWLRVVERQRGLVREVGVFCQHPPSLGGVTIEVLTTLNPQYNQVLIPIVMT